MGRPKPNDVAPARARAAGADFPSYFVSRSVPVWNEAARGPWRLEIGGLVRRPVKLTLAELMDLPRAELRLEHFCVEGWSAVAVRTGVRLSELARQLHMTSPGALKLVDDMVAKGYVSRTPDATDKRVKRLGLTRRGRAALKRAREFHARCERALIDRVGSRRVAATREVLRMLAATDEGNRPPRPRPV